jgi:hypothetical protein
MTTFVSLKNAWPAFPVDLAVKSDAGCLHGRSDPGKGVDEVFVSVSP